MAQISSTHSKRVDKYCSQKQFDDSWERTFGKKEKEDEDKDSVDSTEPSPDSKSGTTG